MVKKLLLTGASGWIGKTIIYEGYKKYGTPFLNENYFVASENKKIHLKKIDKEVEFISLDEALKIHDAKFLIQGAFITKDKIETFGEDRYKRINKELIKKSKALFRNNKLKKSVLLSSGAVYDDDCTYGKLKLLEERSFKSSNKDPLILRIFAGLGFFAEHSGWSALSYFSKCYKENLDIKISANGSVLRSFIDFHDLAKIILIHFESQYEFKKDITYDAVFENICIHEVAEIIAKSSKIKVLYPESFNKKTLVNDYSSNSKNFYNFASNYNFKFKKISDSILNSII